MSFVTISFPIIDFTAPHGPLAIPFILLRLSSYLIYNSFYSLKLVRSVYSCFVCYFHCMSLMRALVIFYLPRFYLK